MRVTRIMQEYIRDEIKKRVEPRYEDAKKAQESRGKALTEFLDHANKELNRMATDMIETFLAEHPEYKSHKEGDWEWVHLYSHHLRESNDDISMYRQRMSDEIDAKYKEIVISLELGGTKADLDELLNNI